MASPNISEILTTTIENRTGKIADNVTKNNAILYKLSQNGNIKTFSGGVTIRQELSYQETQTFGYYSGYDLISTAASDVLTSAEYAIKQAAVSITISGLEQLQNNSKQLIIDLLEARVTNAERTMANNIAIGLYATGTGSGGKEIGGLQLLIADAPGSGTVGGIDRGSWTFWRNAKYAGVADGGTAVSTTNIQSYMNRLYLSIARGTDHPNLIVADNNYYRFYLESLQTIQRVTNTEMAAAGFDNLKYMGADVVYDGGIGGGCPANHMYMINTDYLFYRPHSERNMVPIGGNRQNTNQDAIVKLIGWAGNATVSNSSLQGVLIA